MPQPTEVLRHRWLIVIAAGAIMGAALGVRHVQGLFLQPVVSTQGWPREAFGLALAVQNLVWGLAQPFTGMVADRHGSAKVLALGLLAYAGGLVLMAHAGTPGAFALTHGVLIGMALSGTAFGTVYGALSRIFPEGQRAWAMAVAGALGGLGQFCMVPVAQGLLERADWQHAAVVLGVCLLALAPLAVLLRDRSGRGAAGIAVAQPSMAAAIGQALRHRDFWLLNVGFTACGFQLAFIATHMPAYLAERGLSVGQAGATLAIIALANIFGNYACARLGGRWPPRQVLSALYVARTLAIAVFVAVPVTPFSAYAFSAVMGFLWLGTVPLTNGVLSRIFGVRYIGTLFGLVFLGHQIGGFLGVWLGSLVYDAYRSYDLIWMASIALGLMAAWVHWPIDDRPSPQASTAGIAS
ncbi:transporter [Bordetella ansorpii]|uniref:Transporter n=1 Tax=Bordetella ansorpii TaxID=288768 RepID=A0A157STS3_9BORD|nr:MFS transporter [Bordetella ansorpii]SAI73714.1 transporter [Bordetella ansorpii]